MDGSWQKNMRRGSNRLKQVKRQRKIDQINKQM